MSQKITVFFLLMFMFNTALSLRCKNRVVSLDDSKMEVLQKCGKPILIEKWHEKTIIYNQVTHANADIINNEMVENRVTESAGEIINTSIEEWTFNFSSHRLIVFLTFINGKLKKIEDGGKGFNHFAKKNAKDTQCGSKVSVGDRKINVIKYCGEASFTEQGEEIVFSTLENNRKEYAARTLQVAGQMQPNTPTPTNDSTISKRRILYKNSDRWSYNFGSHRFIVIIEFENGRVVRVENGGYGFD